MKYLHKFNFLLEGLILEKALLITPKLHSVLLKINHPIAKILIQEAENESDVVDNSYISYSEDPGIVTWLPSNREVDFHTKKELTDHEKWNTQLRQKISIGRLVKAILAKKGETFSESEIEKFVNMYKAIQNPSNFKLIKGEDIIKYYNKDNYSLNNNIDSEDSSLWNSCMRMSKCSSYFEVYTKNDNISLLVLLDSEDKVMGRAIIWNNLYFEQEDKNIVYMDRIYAGNNSIEEQFKDYALKNGWWFKTKQSGEHRGISNSVKVSFNPKLKFGLSENNDWEDVQKPFMDTMHLFTYFLVDNKWRPFLISNGYITETNWKQSWTSTSGSQVTNSNYIDPIKNVAILSKTLGIDIVDSVIGIGNGIQYDILLYQNKIYGIYSHLKVIDILKNNLTYDELLELFEDIYKNKTIYDIIKYISISGIYNSYRHEINTYLSNNFDKIKQNKGNKFLINEYLLEFKFKDIVDDYLNSKDGYEKFFNTLNSSDPRYLCRLLLNDFNIDLLKKNEGSFIEVDEIIKVNNEYFVYNDENVKIMNVIINNRNMVIYIQKLLKNADLRKYYNIIDKDVFLETYGYDYLKRNIGSKEILEDILNNNLNVKIPEKIVKSLFDNIDFIKELIFKFLELLFVDDKYLEKLKLWFTDIVISRISHQFYQKLEVNEYKVVEVQKSKDFDTRNNFVFILSK